MNGTLLMHKVLRQMSNYQNVDHGNVAENSYFVIPKKVNRVYIED